MELVFFVCLHDMIGKGTSIFIIQNPCYCFYLVLVGFFLTIDNLGSLQDNLCGLSYVSLVLVLGFHLFEVKRAPKESVRKEEASKDEELLMEVRNFSFHGSEGSEAGKAIIRAQLFTFDQVIAATGNFRSDYFLGEGGFGKVYKGFLADTNEVFIVSYRFCIVHCVLC